MSADNWAYCPKCQEMAQKNIEQLRARVATDYGKIPPDDYIKLLDEVKTPPKLKETLREDYEIGIWGGEFTVSYAASCSVCKFTFGYDVTKGVEE